MMRHDLSGGWSQAPAPPCRRWLGLLAPLLGMAGAVAGAAEVEVRLRHDAAINAAIATLADVAELTGDERAVAGLAPLAVMDLPDLCERVVDARVVRQSLGRAARGLTVLGSCRVHRATRTVAPEVLIAAARDGIAAEGDELRVSVLRPPAAVAVPASTTPPILVATPLDRARSGDIAFTVRVLDGAQEWGRALLTLRIERLRQLAVAARPLRRGEVVGPLDVESRSLPVEAHADYLAAAVASGQTVRLPLEAGAPFTRLNLMPSRDVHGGTPVTVMVERAGFCAIGSGVALSDGAIGDAIQVRRTSDGRVISARITAPGVVTPERM